MAATPDIPPGAIFVLRSLGDDDGGGRGGGNRIHPLHLVHVGADGAVIRDHLSPGRVLETMRRLCAGRTEPDLRLCRVFNEETADGADMSRYSALLRAAVDSMRKAKAAGDVAGLFRAGATTALRGAIGGLDDFALVCFLVILPEDAAEDPGDAAGCAAGTPKGRKSGGGRAGSC